MTKFSAVGAVLLACCLAGCTSSARHPLSSPMEVVQREVMRDSYANAYVTHACPGDDGDSRGPLGFHFYTSQYELEKKTWGYSNMICSVEDVTPERLKAFWERHYIHDYPKDYNVSETWSSMFF
jgi:hypothetical protein